MITSDLEMQYASNISGDNFSKPNKVFHHTVCSLKYQKLMNWVVLHMDQIKCHKTTVYLCRIYIDLFLTSGYPIKISELQLLGISAIILSIKFNESFDYPLKLAVKNSGNQYTILQIANFQKMLYRSLRFKLKYTTPHCYLKNIKQMIPNLDQTFLQQLQILIHYCCVVFSLANVSSGQIIFACLLYLCQKYANISNNIKKIIESISKRFDNVLQILQILKNYLEVEDAHNDQEDIEEVQNDLSTAESRRMEIQQ